MKKALYIGILTQGTTSRMRYESLAKHFVQYDFLAIDTDVPFRNSNRIFKTLGFRYKVGPLIQRINNYILEELSEDVYELIWIDKAIYLTSETTRELRKKTQTLVHFTPDTAFYGNTSKLFESSISLYDFAVTTKAFDLDRYKTIIDPDKIILTSQGYDQKIHSPLIEFKQKIFQVAFIGLCEPSREKVIQFLIDKKIPVKIGGKKWEGFVRKNQGNEYLSYVGNDVRGEEYSKIISESEFALGLLSKKFPELHTTRTFEIPACGTALLTEKNAETNQYFNESEVIFYNSEIQLLEQIQYYHSNKDELERLTNEGMQRVRQLNLNYDSIFNELLKRITKINL